MSDPKISFIMQSYLGSYPGSRSNSDLKFLRAVKSFLDQKDNKHELIIASDGCEITYDLWKRELKGKPGLKFVYVDKDVPNMYESKSSGDSGKYLRGLPRQIARSLVTGEVTTYMDSDDFLMPDATIILKVYWRQYLKDNAGKILAAYTDTWYDNIARTNSNFPVDIDPDRVKIGDAIKISGLESEWIQLIFDKEKRKGVGGLPVTWLMSHTSDVKTKWKDVYQAHGSKDNSGEDNIFGVSMMHEAGIGHIFNIDHPYYVRCHYRGAWDF